MAFKIIGSYEEMIQNLKKDEQTFVLLYKKGSEASDCSFVNVQKAASELIDVNVLAADVGQVRDIHAKYEISSAPSLLVFSGDSFVKTIKGCNDDGFYKGLFENDLFSAKSDGKKQKNVTVYTTPTCTWCNTIKRHFDQNGIRYREVDVSKDQKAAEAMVRKSGQQGVPQTDINGQMIVGFDKNRINTLLEINN